jgi:adenylate cyclase
MPSVSEPQISSTILQRHIDWGRGTVTNGGGASVTLRPQSLSVLKILTDRSGEVVTKDELMAAIWPGIAVTDDSLVQCITELRKALGDDAHSIIKTVPKRGYVLSAEQQSAVLLRQPGIAVLPFVNMSGDPSRDYYGAGMAEDIITMLSCFPWIRVASRTSSFVYNGPVNVQKVGKELGVNYVMEGSVRNAGSKVRVTAQLIDAASGDHVWADRFDEEGGDIAALQDAVGHRIYQTVAGVQGQVMEKERTGAWSKSGPGLEEYDYALRGHDLFLRFEREANFKALAIWQEGLTKFPDSALLRIKVAWGHVVPILYGWTEDTDASLEIAWRLGKEAEAQQDKSRLASFMSHWMMAILYNLYDGDFERSVTEVETAAKIIPYDSLARAQMASYLTAAGRLDRAVNWLEEAMHRDSLPFDWCFLYLATAYYHSGRSEEALALLANFKGALRSPRKIILVAANARLGRLEEARHELARFLAEFPGWTLKKEAFYPSGRHPKFIEPLLTPYLEDLRKAGLPEK